MAGRIYRERREGAVRMARNTRVKYLLGANTEENSDVALRRASASVKFGAYDGGCCCCLRKRVGRVLPGCSSVLAPTEPRNCFRAMQRNVPSLLPTSPLRAPPLAPYQPFFRRTRSRFSLSFAQDGKRTLFLPPSFFLSSTLCIYVYLFLSVSFPRRLSFSGRRYYYCNTPCR